MNPCECGEECGWSSETNRCELGDITSCEECPDVCIGGTCLDLNDTCPFIYNPLLVCQCHSDCFEEENCCDDAALCPHGNILIYAKMFYYGKLFPI
jgi:hypothetical protein